MVNLDKMLTTRMEGLKEDCITVADGVAGRTLR